MTACMSSTNQKKHFLMPLKTTSVKRKTSITITRGAQNVLLDIPIKNRSRYGLDVFTSRSILNGNYSTKNVKFNPNMSGKFYRHALVDAILSDVFLQGELFISNKMKVMNSNNLTKKQLEKSPMSSL